MRLLHLDCFSGLAGDMFLGACLDLGMPLELLEGAVSAFGLEGLGVEARRARRGGLAGVRFRVLLGGRPIEGLDPDEPAAGGPPARLGAGPWRGAAVPLAELRGLAAGAPLEEAVARRTAALFERLGAAETAAAGAGPPPRWSEFAGLDLLVDLVGAAVATEWVRADRISCGPVHIGGAGGPVGDRLPVPGATTARLLAGVPVVGGVGGELLTPTGATLLAELVDEFGPQPPMRVTATGYGLGRAELDDRPNAVRVWLGDAAGDPTAAVGGGAWG